MVRMAQSLPTIVFLAGAFADPSCFAELAARFNQAGYPTVYAHVLSLNPEDLISATTSRDAEYVRENTIVPMLEAGKDVVVFAHSYGGVVGGAAAVGLSKSAETGNKGGVIGLLYLVGNLVGEGTSLKQAVGGAYPPFIKEDHVCTPYRNIPIVTNSATIALKGLGYY
jgi:pimeloyl-ACP methyl ester carboxylesterase